ncbi:MAG: peptidoglycan DD-metalloendopeptidase family protein [Candidatus Kerfeldbacteria bacterium]|nr:peptidoglycan DD-metalloendopeptidase family protein [Candidatus Kerfeldbacteria bacterium]
MLRMVRGFITMLVIAWVAFYPGFSRIGELQLVHSVLGSEIDQRIQEKQKEIEDLKNQADSYEQAIRERQKEADSLKNQIADLDDTIETKQIEINQKNTEIELVELEIQGLEADIEQKKAEISTSKEHLSSTLARAYILEQTSPLEVVMSTTSFSEFFSKMEYNRTIQDETKDGLDTLQALKQAMDEQHQNLSDKQTELSDKRTDLQRAQSNLVYEQDTKETLLTQTEEDEATFQRLIGELKKEQSSVNSEISRLEQQRKQRKGGKGVVASTEWVWPVDGRTITTYFNDPSYVFRRYFNHAALDIDGEQGDPIYAANSGVVSAAHFSGLSFAFLIIDHGNGYSTLYGHPNALYVSVGDEVKQGDVIGAVGGIPGTAGAGYLTTGSHLHFALYKDGIPVDPLQYLP